MKIRTNTLHNGSDLNNSAASGRLNSQGLISAALAATVASISTASSSHSAFVSASTNGASSSPFTRALSTNPASIPSTTISTPRPRPTGFMGHADRTADGVSRDRTHLALDPSKRRSHTTAAVGIDSNMIDTDSPLPKDVLDLVRSITAQERARANDLSPSLQQLINAAASTLTPQALPPPTIGRPPLHRPNQINNELLETPTPTKIIFPKQVTDAQAEFADGFQQALRQVHLQNHYAPTPSLNSPSTVTLLSLITALNSPGFGSNLNSPVNGQPLSLIDPLFAQKLAQQQLQQQQNQLSPSSHSTSTAATLSPLSNSDQSIASLTAANLVVGSTSGTSNSLHVPPQTTNVLPTVVSTAPTPPPPSLLGQVVPPTSLLPPQPPITTAALPSSISASSLRTETTKKQEHNANQGFNDIFQQNQPEMINQSCVPFLGAGQPAHSAAMMPSHMPQQPPLQQSVSLMQPSSMATQQLSNKMEIKSEPHDPPMSQGGYPMVSASSSALHVSAHQAPMSCGSSAYSMASSRGESFDMNDQEQKKLQRKRERNRLAASKCRQRKIARIEELEKEVNDERKKTNKLQQQAEQLKRDLEHCRAIMEQHQQKGCVFSGNAVGAGRGAN